MPQELSFGDVSDIIEELEVEFNEVTELKLGSAGLTNNCTIGGTTINSCCHTF